MAEVAEVHEITIAAVKDLADEICLGRYLPAVGDYLLVGTSCWFGTVLEPTYSDTYTNLQYAQEILSYLESMRAEARKHMDTEFPMCDAYELWHVVC